MEPDRGFPQAGSAHDTFWDFISLMPESMHMIMWAMSDRTIPRSLRMMEGFGVHSFRLLDAGRQQHLRQVPLATEARPAVDGLGRGGEAAGARTTTSIVATCSKPSSAATSRNGNSPCSCSPRRTPTQFPFDHLDPTKLIPEELVPLTGDRPDGARSLAGQLLRRDRAGRVLPGEHRAGHRLQQRSAAAGAAVLLPRHAAVAPGGPELPPDADQRAEVPVREPAARRTHADARAEGTRQLRTQ